MIVYVSLEVDAPDGADPDSVAGLIFDWACNIGPEADEYIRSVNGYDYTVAPES
jgi:hypothetical protein